VLYADDMLQLRELIAIVLGRDGHTVETAANGQEALAMAQGAATPVDLVISDVMMPLMDGFALAQSWV